MIEQIGGPESAITESGTSFELSFYVSQDDYDNFLATYKPGSDADWVPESERKNPNGTTIQYVVTELNKGWKGPDSWTVTVSAKPAQEAVFNNTESNLADDYSGRYFSGSITLSPNMFGARKASQTDQDSTLRNVDNNFCVVGDYVYRDATNSSKGSPNYSRSPFSNSSGLSHPEKYIGQKYAVTVYECTFHRKCRLKSVGEFCGINGSISNTELRPHDWNTSGKWRVVPGGKGQQLELLHDNNGDAWVKITRRMIHAPLNLLWDEEKNGGEWSW